ncbi:MAG: LacI family transcriptional regulator, partial [Flavobacteriales bacterium CG03_land_8_20_14_0_80_35_15]
IVANAHNIDVKIMHLLKHKKIDAILALDEDAVLATYKASKFNNYNLDHQLAIIGYASEKIAENLTPSLTTLNQHGERIGRNSA